jgi:protein SCO1/2
VVLAITASWWALALWPMSDAAPDWLARTRLVCFGATRTGLPDAGGWMLLVGQPLGMMIMLFAVWGDEVRAGFAALLGRVSGQISVGVTAAALVIGLVAAGTRVRNANAAPFDANPADDLAAQLTPLRDPAAEIGLVNQAGDTVSLAAYRGRAVLVTFAFGNCQTVCPLVVHASLAARDKIAATMPERTPAIVVVTLDPWRDTPSRLSSIAERWGLTGDAHVVSGAVDDVERTLNRWRIPRVRNGQTGDITHPSIVYVVGPDGRLRYAVNGTSEQIIAAIGAM